MKFRRSPGTALDRDPLDPDKLDGLMLFLKDRLSPDDFSKFSDLIDDLQDDAEEANPSKEMATDAIPTATRRRIRREVRSIRLGMAGEASMAQDAASRQSFNDRYPEAARIKTDLSWSGQPASTPPAPRVAMDASAAKSFDERFGTGRIGHAG